MWLPQGFQSYNADGSPKFAKLTKSLYGLHQAGREWYMVLKAFFIQEGFHQLLETDQRSSSSWNKRDRNLAQ